MSACAEAHPVFRRARLGYDVVDLPQIGFARALYKCAQGAFRHILEDWVKELDLFLPGRITDDYSVNLLTFPGNCFF